MKLKQILIVILIIQLSNISVFPTQPLTQKDLEADMRYYNKISVEKNFTKNDKLYLLNKLFDKYRNTDLDISAIVKEIDKINKESKKVLPVEKKTVVVEKKPIVSQEEQNYVITSGDIIYIYVTPSEELSRESIVNADGMITFPLIGAVKASGLTVKELSTVLEKALSVYITDPKVTITMKSFSKKQIFIMGEIRQSGGYQYKEGMKLLDLITTAGGFTNFAGTKNIKIYRGEKDKRQTITVNLEEIMKTGDTTKDFVLRPGDIVEVPRQPKTVSVIGAVNSPGNFDWYEGINLLEAISLAKGQTDFASLGAIKIFRGTTQQQKMLVVNLNNILKGDLKNNLVLEPGDIIVIPRKPLVASQWFVNTVLPWLSLIAMTFVIINYTK
ncbi:MAG: polysaccharide biosynthesis/export family protein [Endomicrobiia bacterium]